MVEKDLRSRVLPIISIIGLLVAALTGLAEHVPWLEAVCTGLAGGCKDTVNMTFLHLPIWAWGIAFYVLLAFASFRAVSLVFGLVSCAVGAEIVLVWYLVTMKAACIFCIGNLFVVLLALVFSFERAKFWQGLSMCLLFFIFTGILMPMENRRPRPAEAKQEDTSGIAAKVGDEIITKDRIEAPLADKILDHEREIYVLKQERLNQIIMETLLQREAKERGISIDQLLNESIPKDAFKVTDEEVETYRQEHAEQLQRDWRGTEEDLRVRIKGFILQQKRFREVNNYSKTLENKYKVIVYLNEPQAMRTIVSIDGSPSMGPPKAPVLVVEFSDYQCPACRQAHETVRQVRDIFKDQVRWVFKDFPLRRHKDSKKAAEAARCAAEQGKFWDYQNLLFTSQEELNQDRLEKYAEGLGLDRGQFGQCLSSEKYKAAVEKDMEDGKNIGVDSTPTYVLNGKIAVGGPPLEQFKSMIEGELNVTKRTP
jgi:protein-disulfide isomerase